ncbi:MAG: CSLREA domain-containing protein, partial [Anaerolineales bacterium]|nr:CSLREA domain-containing protein [Anaerolineales bacterium]
MSRRKLTVLITMLSLSFVLSGCGLIDIILADPIRARLDAACAAAPFEVTKTEDTYDALCTTGDCSLREAVFTANACEGAQEIHLENETYELTRMDPGDYEDPNAAGGLVLTESATIVGNDAIVDGQNAVRVFDIRLDSGESVTFDEFRIRNGFSEDNGGGVRIVSGPLILNDMLVSDNRAGADDPSATASGGAIYVAAGSLTVTQSIITGNEAAGNGGGISVAEGAELDVAPSSSISDNLAADETGGASVGGGGVYNAGEARISGIVQENRAASGHGGAIFNAATL